MEDTETKIVYYIDGQETPYLIRLNIPPSKVTLGDFKNGLNRPNQPAGNWKFYFKSHDVDFGVVKEELVDDAGILPSCKSRVVSWLVTADQSDTQSQATTEGQPVEGRPPAERLGGIGDSRPPSFHAKASVESPCDTCADTESVMTSSTRPGGQRYGPPRPRYPHGSSRQNGTVKDRLKIKQGGEFYDTSSSMMTSDLESTSYFDSDEDSTRFSTTTETTARSSKYGPHKRRRRRRKMPPMSKFSASSFSSITDSTMSLNIITVSLNMDTVNFLGISIVGQSNKGGDGGIYVGSIMKGGAVALDGRIEPGDMILEVNSISFESMSNDDAVKTLREAVQQPGPITLVVAKCWDPSPRGYFTIPRHEPVRPIDPSAWVAHTAAVRGDYPGRRVMSLDSSFSTVTSQTSSMPSSLPSQVERTQELNLTVHTDMTAVVQAMAQPDSGLEIRNRTWLKITIPNAFIGSDLVDWLFLHVDGFTDRRDARKYATSLLKETFIRHTVNKISFSEQCYYVLGRGMARPDVQDRMAMLQLEDVDSVSEIDRDTLAPLPPPSWGGHYMYPGHGGYPPHHPFTYSNEVASLASFGPTATGGSGGSVHSAGSGGSSGSGGSVKRRGPPAAEMAGLVSRGVIIPGDRPPLPADDTDGDSVRQNMSTSPGGPPLASPHKPPVMALGPPIMVGPPPPGPNPQFVGGPPPGVGMQLGSIPSEVSGSRQSFQMGLGHNVVESEAV